MKASISTLVALFGVSASPVAEVEQHHQRIFEQIADAVVYIATPRGFGSGFFVASDGLILTNAHVVEERDVVDVVLHDGRHFSGAVVEKAQDNIDLALVRVPVSGVSVLVTDGAALAELRVGSWVASVGHGQGGIWTFNTGMVSNIYPSGDERPIFQTQIPLNPGSSGGPIVDREGRVVGIVTAGISEANSINFGIKIDAARHLSQLPIGPLFTVLAPAGVPVFVDDVVVGTGPSVSIPLSAGPHQVFVVIAGRMRKKQIIYPQEIVLDLRKP